MWQNPRVELNGATDTQAVVVWRALLQIWLVDFYSPR